MKKDIAEFVYACLVCQKSKIEHQKPSGLMQPLFVPKWKWNSISMDFVGALPKTVKGFDSIWVVVDRLTKSAHFIPIKTGMSMARLAEIYIEKVVRLHGIPSSIVSDRDPRFTSMFWESFQAALGTKLRLSSTYHPQTDGQTDGLLHDVFHVSQLRKYVYDKSHVIQVDELEVRDNLTVETWPIRIEDCEVKHLRGKEIVLVKVIWVGPTGESATLESESRIKDSYPELFPSGNFRGRKFF